MRIVLKGIHKVRRRLSDDGVAEYHYAWRGGPRLTGKPGSPEYVRSYTDAYDAQRAVSTDTVAGLVASYRASAKYEGLRATTRADYERCLKRIVRDFGDLPTVAAEIPKSRPIFRKWRDGMKAQPRTADRHLAVLSVVFAWAVSEGIMKDNPCSSIERIYRGTRRDEIWSDAQITKFMLAAPEYMQTAMLLAFHTGQRQGDLLSLMWSQIKSGRITLTQSKGGKRVSILMTDELRAHLDGVPRPSTHVLVSSLGKPWGDRFGFKKAWSRVCDRAEIEGVTFHDLRGTAVVRLARLGASVPQIASVTGHSLKSVERILEEHYLAQGQNLADDVIIRMNQERKL